MPYSWTRNILMSSVTGWPHLSNRTATQFHCQPLAHLLLPTFISLKLLPQCPVFIDLSEQPFGLSYGLVIGHRPPPTTAGVGGFISLQTCLQHHIPCVSDWSAEPQRRTPFSISNKRQYGAFMGPVLFNMQWISDVSLRTQDMRCMNIYLNVFVILEQHYASLQQQIHIFRVEWSK